MDFSPEELDVSPPCFLVENSQAGESQQLCRSDSDQHLAILKSLPVFAVSARADPSVCSTNDHESSAHRNPVAVSCPTGGGENGGQGEPGDLRGGQGEGGQEQGGGDNPAGNGGDGGGDGDGGGNEGGEGGQGGYGGGGDDGGGGGDDGDDGNDDDDNDEESPPAEEPSSSSSTDALPRLIRPESIISDSQWKGQRFSTTDIHVQQATERGTSSDSSLSAVVEHGSGGSIHESSGDRNSQASTGVVGEGDDVAADMPSVAGTGSLSEGSTAPVVSPAETEKKSTSSSSTGHKSDGSAASSSSYHADLSSLSSAGSLPSPEVQKHLHHPLLSMLRTQSTSDTSSSSAGSKEEKVHSKVTGFKLWSVEEKDESAACSSQEDLFAPCEGDKEQEHVHSDMSEEGSHILPPRHHSTPTDGHDKKESHERAHEKSLYQQVLTAKQRTSTPVEGGEFFSTPPSQGTPIDTVSRFHSLQFSGEVSAKETTSSSSDQVTPSPEERSSIPVLVPSSPTAVQDDSAEEQICRKGTTSEGKDSVGKDAHEDIQGQSEIAKAAAALVESFDLSEGEHAAQLTSQKHKQTSDDDEVMIPRWQQLQEMPKQSSGSDDKKSTSSNPSSSEGQSSDDAVKGDSQPPQMQEWQSVISAMGSTSSSSQGAKIQTTGKVSTTNKEQVAEVRSVDMSFLESTKAAPLISKTVCPKETPQGDKSLSPSSLAVDPFNPEDTRKHTEEVATIIVGPTQPEMSEDMFRPSISQESAEQQDIPDQPAAEQIEEDKGAEDSQEIIFSLHLTQSQADLDSQLPLETILPAGEITEEVTVTETVGDITEDKTAETTQKEEVVSLTKQDSSSQSILAPLIQPLPSVIDAPAAKDKDLEQEQPSSKVLSDVAANVVLSDLSSRREEEKGGKSGDEFVRDKEAPQPSTEKVPVVSPPEQPILAEDSEGGAPPMEKGTSAELVRRQLSTPEKDIPTRKPIKPRLPAAIFSEPSSESGPSGGFHFSPPKEPLRPVISTTPPPIRPIHHDTPDSQERSSRRSIIPDVVPPVVSETPGMSSQVPPSSLDQLRPQSLTISMPRHGSPLSDSESSEPVFRLDTTLPPVSTTPGSSGFVQPSAPEPSRSIFSRAREAIARGKKREVEADSEHDPFAFTAEDEDPEPIRKKPRRASPRRAREEEIRPRRDIGEIDKTREASTGGAEERPSYSGDQSIDRSKEQNVSTKRGSLQERVRSKRGRHDNNSESTEGEESEESVSKRARKEEGEPTGEKSQRATPEAVHYRQITHTRIVTTVTTQVQRVVTVSIVDKESGDVVQVLTYEEDDRPKIETEEKEKEEVDEFVESSSLDGSRVMLTPKSPKRQELQQQSRSSPRTRNGKTPVVTQSVSKPAAQVSDKTKATTATPREKGADGGLGEAVGKSREKSDHPQSRDDESLGEIPAITRQPTMPVGEEEPPLQRTSSSDSSLTPGTRVLAKWLDSYFYPGIVTTKQYKNGRYLVTFDDGDKRRIPRENLIVKDLLPAGQSVMAQGDIEDDFYEVGVIVGHYRDGDERGYEIQTQRGAISRFPRNRVILSEQQAAAILSSESSFNVTSGSSVSIGAHSLRLRKDGSAGNSGASLNITKSGSTGVKDTSRDTSSKDTSGSSSDEKTRGKKAARRSPYVSPRASKSTATADETPKSTHKSTHKAKAQVRRAGHRIGESESSSDEQHGARPGKKRQVRRGLSASYGAKSPVRVPSEKPLEPPTRRSPRKQPSRKEDDEGSDNATGSIPANRNIFAGLAFLVTGLVRDRNEPDESDSESERIEFNRDNIKRQIEAGGGVVLSSFTQSQISGAECFLISNRHQRTQKYFQSLASGIPCVSHMWIHDSCACDKRLDYRRYLLPAGESLEADGEVVECRPRRNILGNIRVYLHGSQTFKDTWSSVLLAAGCRMVTKIPNRLDYQCDVIICEDNKLPASVKHAANVLGIPIVSLEWLLQSLINGRQVPFGGHPKYDYRYKSS